MLDPFSIPIWESNGSIVSRVDESRECATDHMTGLMLVAPVAPHLVSVVICRSAFCDVTEMSVLLLLGYLLLFI